VAPVTVVGGTGDIAWRGHGGRLSSPPSLQPNSMKGQQTMKFGTCNEYFEGWTIEDVFDYAGTV